MGRRPDQARRAALLEAVADEIAERGITVSLRPLAAAVGTSPRVLLHHFGTRQGMIREALAVLRDRAGVTDPESALAAAGSPAELARALWALAGTPEADRFLRVFFELYAGALRDPHGHAGFLHDSVAWWLVPLSGALRETGLDPEAADAVATDALATFHGLLMDRLATGDTDRVERGFALLVARLETAGGG